MVDRVRVQKQERSDIGGSDIDEGLPGPININEDHLDARGLYFQNDTSNTTTVHITRDSSNNLTFQDPVAGGPHTLSTVLSGGGISEAQHKALRQLAHFIDNGPGDGFGAGPNYSETDYSGVFPTAETWYTDNTETLRIFKWEGTYNSNKTFATEKHTVYKLHNTAAAEALDTITYSGVLETSRSRAFTVY